MPITRSKNKILEKLQDKQELTQQGHNEQKQQKEENKEKKQQKEEKKEKKNLKPKKYKNKTIQEKERIQRSKQQRIYLINALRQDEQWEFTVQGTKGSQYHVKISTQIKCTCIDFRIKKIPCKHIYFIVTQVGQNDDLLDYFKDDRKISKAAYKVLDSQLFNKLKRRLEKQQPTKEIDLKEDTNCVICFSQMQKQVEILEECSTCSKYFHHECLTAWKAHNPTCPLCRGKLEGNPNDPLAKIQEIDI